MQVIAKSIGEVLIPKKMVDGDPWFYENKMYNQRIMGILRRNFAPILGELEMRPDFYRFNWKVRHKKLTLPNKSSIMVVEYSWEMKEL